MLSLKMLWPDFPDILLGYASFNITEGKVINDNQFYIGV